MPDFELAPLLNSIPTCSGYELECKLTFLIVQPGTKFTPQNKDFFCNLLKLPKGAPTEPPTRLLATQVVFRCGDKRFWEKVIQSGDLRPGDVVFFRERWPLEQRFLNLQTGIGYASLRQALDLATLGHVLVSSNRFDRDLDRYVADLDTTLHEEHKGRSDPFHPRFRVAFSVAFIRAVVRRHSKVVTAWLDLVVKRSIDWHHMNFVKSTFPVYEALCEALFLEGDSRASDLYSALRDATRQKPAFIQDRIGDSLPRLLLRVDTDEVLPHRRAWYQCCGGDLALLDFATAVRQHGREAFLLELIQEGLASPVYFDQAKAISLAGWCGTHLKFRSLLEQLRVEPDSWFDSLRKQALWRGDRESWARSWLSDYLSARSLAESFAAFRLFLRCVDRRYCAWRGEILGTAREASITAKRRLKFLTTNYREIEESIERNEKGLDKQFLYLGIPDERLAPWTGLPPAREATRRRQDLAPKR